MPNAWQTSLGPEEEALSLDANGQSGCYTCEGTIQCAKSIAGVETNDVGVQVRDTKTLLEVDFF